MYVLLYKTIQKELYKQNLTLLHIKQHSLKYVYM